MARICVDVGVDPLVELPPRSSESHIRVLVGFKPTRKDDHTEPSIKAVMARILRNRHDVSEDVYEWCILVDTRLSKHMQEEGALADLAKLVEHQGSDTLYIRLWNHALLPQGIPMSVFTRAHCVRMGREVGFHPHLCASLIRMLDMDEVVDSQEQLSEFLTQMDVAQVLTFVRPQKDQRILLALDSCELPE